MKPWRENVIFGMQVQLQNIWVKFAYQGRREGQGHMNVQSQQSSLVMPFYLKMR